MTNRKKIKVLYITDSTSVHTQRWVKYFVDRGYEIYLITIGKKRQTLPDVLHVINFNQFYYNSPTFLFYLFKTRRLIRTIQPDILHAHFVHQYGWLGALSGFHPFVLTSWGTDILNLPYSSRLKIGKLLTQYAFKKADLLTATSEYLKSEMIKLGADREKIHVIFWGVNSQKFRPDTDTRKCREKLKISDKGKVVLSNRNYAPLYNNDIVIEAMTKVLKHHPDAVLILQNAGGSTKREPELKRLVAEKGIERSVRFLPQYKHNELPPLYALADIYVSVPTWDAGPVSLKEAMASHCTPIISDVPGPKEWVSHEKNGMVVPIRNADTLASTICELLSDKEKRQRFNQINRELIINKAEHSDQMKKIESLYFRMLKVS